MAQYPAYSTLPRADTESVPVPAYMCVDRVRRPCTAHRPLALHHQPGEANSVAVRLRFGMMNKYVVCSVCGATSIHGLARLRWGDNNNLKIKAEAAEFNRRVAEELAATAA